jgi:hypothetical protein
LAAAVRSVIALSMVAVTALTLLRPAGPVPGAPAHAHPLLQSPLTTTFIAVHLPLALHSASVDALPAAPTAAPATQVAPSTATRQATVSPTPSPTPLASPTVLPADCESPLRDGDFEAGSGEESGWQQEALDGAMLIDPAAARRGGFGARLGGRAGAQDVLLSDVAVPTFAALTVSATLRLWLRMDTLEPLGDGRRDRLILAVVGDLPEAIEPVATLGDEDMVQGPQGEPVWTAYSFDVSEAFTTREDFSTASLALVSLLDPGPEVTTFDVDDIALELCPVPPSGAWRSPARKSGAKGRSGLAPIPKQP